MGEPVIPLVAKCAQFGPRPPRIPEARPLGEPNIYPSSLPHAISASFPTWASVIGASTGASWVSDKIIWQYPRFWINPPIRELAQAVRQRLELRESVECMIFPSRRSARECALDLEKVTGEGATVKTASFSLPPGVNLESRSAHWASFYVVVYPNELGKVAEEIWRDFGGGISSRHAEYCLKELDHLHSESEDDGLRTPAPFEPVHNKSRQALDMFRSAESDMTEVKSVIAQLVASEQTEQAAVSPDDVFLYHTGMAAVSAVCRAILSLERDSSVVAYGWLYVETVSVLRRGSWDVISYHWGTEEDLNDLERRLVSGQRIRALFCELPSNVKLTSVNLQRIGFLAKQYDFIVVCDETVGNFINIDVLPWADLLMTSLTKCFSGAGDVTGGSVIVNPSSPRHGQLHDILAAQYENTCFPVDIATLRRNCGDMAARVHAYNANTSPVVNLLAQHASIARVYYPSLGSTAAFYETYRRKYGGYGNLLSVVFHRPRSAEIFYDSLDVCKGGSFGTNFTLVIPFVQLANYRNQDKVIKYDLPPHIIRISIGMEDGDQICAAVRRALEQVEEFETGSQADQGP